MLNLKKLKKSKFSLVESVRTYRDMALRLFVPVLKASFIAVIFIFLVQTALSFATHGLTADIVFWVWTLFVIIVSTCSFFKTSEDIILDKKPHVYSSISHILLLSARLFAVVAIIAGVAALLITPMFFLKNPLFALPYKFLVVIFAAAVIPYIYFAPLAVVLREADIVNSFIFSYYMVLARWSKVAKAILVQLIFTGLIAFWVYLFISVIFFPHSADFFNFLLSKATSLDMQARTLYVPFIFWEMMQIFAFTLVTAIFTGANTILFMHLEGTLFKLVKDKLKFKVNPMKPQGNNNHFLEVLSGGKSVVHIEKAEKKNDTDDDEEEYFDDGYSEYQESLSMTDDAEKDNEFEIIEGESAIEQDEKSALEAEKEKEEKANRKHLQEEQQRKQEEEEEAQAEKFEEVSEDEIEDVDLSDTAQEGIIEQEEYTKEENNKPYNKKKEGRRHKGRRR